LIDSVDVISGTALGLVSVAVLEVGSGTIVVEDSEILLEDDSDII
jgi:hypothetical protein